jgi:uncharacterized membrane protein
MNFSLHDLKLAMYATFGLIGLFFMVLAILLDRASETVDDPTFYLSSIILLAVGAASIFFCVESYLLRGEDDIWQ